MGVKVTLNHGGIASILQSGGMHALVQEATEKIASAAEGSGVMVDGIPGEYEIPVKWTVTTTDRAHGMVTLAHPSGQAVQAKHGLLTGAAGGVGLEMKGGSIRAATGRGK